MKIIGRLTREIPEDTLTEVAQKLAHLPACARHASDRPDEFWEGQQASIWRRISVSQLPSSRLSQRSVWAGLSTVSALAMLLLFSGNAPEPARHVQKQTDSDHELLLAVERAIQIDGPEALEPAALLAREISEGHPDHSVNKGNQNHED